MQNEKAVAEQNEEEVWQQISADLVQNPLNYRTLIQRTGRNVVLYIDVDSNDGSGNGYPVTLFSAPVQTVDDFRLAVHEEGWLDGAAKLFGLEDVQIGDPPLDGKLLIKTNDANKAKILFAEEDVRAVFQSLHRFTLQIVRRDGEDNDKKEAHLELNIEEGITHPGRLRRIYRAFFRILVLLEAA